jgi:DNA (cytosine-5)-methyltransferase 1
MSIALNEWVKPRAYCEIDPYCQGIILSRITTGELQNAPIWDDIKTLDGSKFARGYVDIIFGGFPCQDISVAGRGRGLEGERSGLFFEIVRLSKEIKPKFIFLENVPAITSRGGLQVVREVAEMGYDCRWCVISAASIGALHKRERWFLLAYAKSEDRERLPIGKEKKRSKLGQFNRDGIPNSSGVRCEQGSSEGIHSEWQASEHEEFGNTYSEISNKRRSITDTHCQRICKWQPSQQECGIPTHASGDSQISNYWQNTEPPVCGVAYGVPHRVDRIRGLGNAVVPQQAKEAFKILMGIKPPDEVESPVASD